MKSESESNVLGLKEVETTVGRLKCPQCNRLSWSAAVKDTGLECLYCGVISPRESWQIVEVEAKGYVCPNCGEVVADVPENHSIGVWGGPEPVVLCPKCLTVLKGYIHHEDPHGAKIEIQYEDTGGYIHVWHRDCAKAAGSIGHMTLKRLCVDAETKRWLRKHGYSGKPASRVVLVYVCDDCGAQQVVKACLEDVRIWDSNAEKWWGKK